MVEPSNQVIVQLNKYFTSSHDHMVFHMVEWVALESAGAKVARGVGLVGPTPAHQMWGAY